MGTKVFRIVCALCLAFSAVGFSASAALADAPVRFDFPLSVTAEHTELCSFPIMIDTTYDVKDMTFIVQGQATREQVYVVEVDVFSANGKSLTSLPYTYKITWVLDKSGIYVEHVYSNGLYVKVPLPDGKMFISVGRADITENPNAPLWFPDNGRDGDIDAFCAALAP